MKQFSMLALTLALMGGFAHAQEATQTTDAPVPSDQFAAKKITPPKLRNNANIEFSDEARAKKINGRCLILLTVDVNGMPQEIKLVRCSDPSFAKNSLDSVAKYRFKPAFTQDGKPVSTRIHAELEYRRDDLAALVAPVRYRMSTPPGVISSDPGADGVYPLTKSVTPPDLIRFSDSGYGVAAFNSPEGNGSCDIMITISAAGKATDPKVTHCERPELEKPAVQSLLESKFKSGSVNGKPVPIRTTVHLEYYEAPVKP